MLQLLYMGVSLGVSAWLMKWLISAMDPEKENKKRVSISKPFPTDLLCPQL